MLQDLTTLGVATDQRAGLKPGIAATLIALRPELGSLSPKQVAALEGWLP